MKKTKKTPKILSLAKETIASLTIAGGAGTIVQEEISPIESGMAACPATQT